MLETKPLIKLDKLTVVYDLGKSNETLAVSDINLEIFPGEYVIFFGPSGCGKSTLLYTIAGLEPPTKGDVLIKDVNLKDIALPDLIHFYRSTIGMIFQAYHLIPHLTAKDNILLPQMFLASDKETREKKVQAVMQRFGIQDFADRKPSRMSGGQQQRTAIARSLINDPDVLLADEPVGNLDSKNAQIVLDLLLDINEKEQKTVIYVTHNPRDLHYAHRVFYMKDGKIERVIKNRERGVKLGSAEGGSDIEQMAQLYPYLSEFKLQAKLILNHFLAPYDIGTQEKIENYIEKYVKGEVDAATFYNLLNSAEGAALYSQKAKDLSGKIDKLMEEIRSVRAQEAKAAGVEERAVSIRKYLLDDYIGTLSYEQIERLGHFIRERLQSRFDSKDLRRVFDLSFADGGVGLNIRTAERFSREIELILMGEKKI